MKYLCGQLASLDQISYVSSLGGGGGGERPQHVFLGRSDQNCGFYENQKLPQIWHGENRVFIFDRIFMKLADNQNRNNDFEFGSDRIIYSGVTCP